MLTAFALLGRGEIFSCRNAAGQLIFQDQPCAGAKSAPLAASEDSAAGLSALRRALAQRRPAQTPPTSAPTGQSTFASGPVSEAQLSACSARFFDCAHGNAPAMDRCVSALPRCTANQRSSCCPQACIARYQGFRQQGLGMAAAVRLALIDPSAPGCGSAAQR